MQAADDGQLIEVILVPVMGLADEHHPAVRQPGDQGLKVRQVGEIDHKGAGIQKLVLTQRHG